MDAGIQDQQWLKFYGKLTHPMKQAEIKSRQQTQAIYSMHDFTIFKFLWNTEGAKQIFKKNC